MISRNGSNLSDSQTLTKDALMSLIRHSIANYTAEDNYLGKLALRRLYEVNSQYRMQMAYHGGMGFTV